MDNIEEKIAILTEFVSFAKHCRKNWREQYRMAEKINNRKHRIMFRTVIFITAFYGPICITTLIALIILLITQ